LDYDSELCLVIRFLFLLRLYTCRQPDSFEHLMRGFEHLMRGNTVSVHDFIWSVYVKLDCNSFRNWKPSIVQ